MIASTLTALAALSTLTAASSFVIEHTRVEVGDGAVLDDVDVVVVDGRITAVGRGAAAPKDAARIDGKGRVVTPGLIELKTAIGLVEIDAEPASNDAMIPQPFTPAVRPSDAFHLDSARLAVARAGGVTHIVTAPQGGVLAGQGMWVALDDQPLSPNALVVGIYGSLDEGVRPMAGGARGLVWLRLREITDDARTFDKKRAAYEAGASRPFTLSAAHLAALAPVVKGERPLVLEVDSATDMRALFAFLDEEKARGSALKVVLTGAREAWVVKEELAKRQIPVVVTPTMQVPDAFGSRAARDDAAAVLDAAGVPLVLSTNGWANNAARLRQEAGIAVAHGLPRDRALRAITSTPAAVVGIDDVGRVAPKMRAHLVVWSGDPLEVLSVAERVFIDGREVSLKTRQRALAEKYRAQK